MLTTNEKTTIAASPEDPVDVLRGILASHKQFVSYAEAAEVGDALLAFFELLALPGELDYE